VLVKAVNGSDSDRNRLLAPLGTEGRTLQDELLSTVVTTALAGPHGWLAWTQGMRNAITHRAHRFVMRRFYRINRRGQLEYALHLAKDPQLTDAEAFVLAADPSDIVLWEHAGTTMAGVLDQLLALTSHAFQAMDAVWQRRREQPGVLSQAEEQWKSIYPTKRDLSGFRGFGVRLPAAEGEMRISPDTGKRFRAAKILDSDRPYWWEAFADQ
jgi:hypothetical protein